MTKFKIIFLTCFIMITSIPIMTFFVSPSFNDNNSYVLVDKSAVKESKITTATVSMQSVHEVVSEFHNETKVQSSEILTFPKVIITDETVEREQPVLTDAVNIESLPVYDANGEIVRYLDVRIYDVNGDNFNEPDRVSYLTDVAKIIDTKDLLGIPREAMLAMSYTEGGAGKTGVYVSTNNMFGITASGGWEGMIFARSDKRVYASYDDAVSAGASGFFRVYEDMESSVSDYINLITLSPGYSSFLNTDASTFLHGILSLGYGEEGMGKVWLSLINEQNLTKY